MEDREVIARAVWDCGKLLDSDECTEIADAVIAAFEASGRAIVPVELLERLAALEQQFKDCRTALLATGAALAEATAIRKEPTDVLP